MSDDDPRDIVERRRRLAQRIVIDSFGDNAVTMSDCVVACMLVIAAWAGGDEARLWKAAQLLGQCYGWVSAGGSAAATDSSLTDNEAELVETIRALYVVSKGES